MTLAWLNRCAFVPVAYSSADDFEVNGSAPVTGFYAPADCLDPTVVDGATYHYFAQSADKTQHEEGDAIWDDGAGKLLRASAVVRNSSNGAALVNFSAAPIVTMGSPTALDMRAGIAGGMVLNLTGLTNNTAGLSGSLDIADDSVVRVIEIIGNPITSLDASRCTALIEMRGSNCQIAEALFSGCGSLEKIDLTTNLITQIDVAGCSALTTLVLTGNLLATIDVSSNLALLFASLGENQLTESAVDGVLNALDVNGLSGGDVDMSGGTSAPPSAAGLTSKSNLEGRGWTVEVNT